MACFKNILPHYPCEILFQICHWINYLGELKKTNMQKTLHRSIFFKRRQKLCPFLLIKKKRIAQLINGKLEKTDTNRTKQTTHKARKLHIRIGIPTNTRNTPQSHSSTLAQQNRTLKGTTQQKEKGNTTTKE
jgi:hypothetical protein